MPTTALEVEEAWLRRHVKKLPHTKLGGRVLTEGDLQRIVDLFHKEPSAAIRSAGAQTVGAHPLGALRPLPRTHMRRTT
ncbi:DNA-binding protein [Streptomyces sp. NPDC058086]|uniref:DNA-binding protein n=1 Tax=Streptomyces sp. NPDC058086 TaxID=3346334 RepID=UPI0036E16494